MLYSQYASPKHEAAMCNKKNVWVRSIITGLLMWTSEGEHEKLNLERRITTDITHCKKAGQMRQEARNNKIRGALTRRNDGVTFTGSFERHAAGRTSCS